MAKCEKCGAPIQGTENRCPYCGSLIPGAPDPSAAEGAFFGSSFGNVGASVSGTGTNTGSYSASNTSGRTDGTVQSFFSNLTGNQDQNSAEEAHLSMKISAFIFPFIGLIMILMYRKKAPGIAKSLTPWVIAGFVKSFILGAMDGSLNSVSTVVQLKRLAEIIS
ncbi:MAG: hypothetical protein J5744_03490 [Oscillospiraceae bacterium]|nr:hypothetical protein [Oscillospiraceae bacterium]